MGDGDKPQTRDASDAPVSRDADLSDVRQRLDDLEGKIKSHQSDPLDEEEAKRTRANYTLAVRVSSDFIAAIFVGGALGWLLDSMAGTSPFGLVILLLLGFAAGVLNVMRTLGLVAMPRGATRDGVARTLARRHDTEENGRGGS